MNETINIKFKGNVVHNQVFCSSRDESIRPCFSEKSPSPIKELEKGWGRSAQFIIKVSLLSILKSFPFSFSHSFSCIIHIHNFCASLLICVFTFVLLYPFWTSLCFSFFFCPAKGNYLAMVENEKKMESQNTKWVM